jgi:RecB family exonuclease
MTDEGLILPGDDEAIDVLSGSSLNTFLRCAKQWEYAYVYRFKRPPNLKMVKGTAGHKAAEVHLLAKLDTPFGMVDGPVDVALDAFSDSFDEEAKEAFEEPDKGLTKAKVKDKGIGEVKYWHKEVAPQIQPQLMEQPISFLVNGIPWTGTIDLVDAEDRVRDWKFTGRTPSSADSYILNMVGYAIGYRNLTGKVESQIVLDHVVGLVKPKYVPIRSDGPVSDQSIVAFADIVQTAMRSINAGIFPANGLKSGACSWCGYRDICPAYKESPMHPKEPVEVELV